MQHGFTKLGQSLLYSIPLLLAIGLITLHYSKYVKFGVLGCVADMIKFISIGRIDVEDCLYNNFEAVMGYSFYVVLGLLIIVAILAIWDFFRKKKEPESSPEVRAIHELGNRLASEIGQLRISIDKLLKGDKDRRGRQD